MTEYSTQFFFSLQAPTPAVQACKDFTCCLKDHQPYWTERTFYNFNRKHRNRPPFTTLWHLCGQHGDCFESRIECRGRRIALFVICLCPKAMATLLNIHLNILAGSKVRLWILTIKEQHKRKCIFLALCLLVKSSLASLETDGFGLLFLVNLLLCCSAGLWLLRYEKLFRLEAYWQSF